MTTDKIIRARAKAFATEGVREYKFLVTPDDITVYDSVAGHYTHCNSLTVAAKKRIRKLAAAA